MFLKKDKDKQSYDKKVPMGEALWLRFIRVLKHAKGYR
jgi:hypothetical protein